MTHYPNLGSYWGCYCCHHPPRGKARGRVGGGFWQSALAALFRPSRVVGSVPVGSPLPVLDVLDVRPTVSDSESSCSCSPACQGHLVWWHGARGAWGSAHAGLIWLLWSVGAPLVLSGGRTLRRGTEGTQAQFRFQAAITAPLAARQAGGGWGGLEKCPGCLGSAAVACGGGLPCPRVGVYGKSASM